MRPDPAQLGISPLFASLTAEQRKAIASLMEHRDEAAGTVLVGERSRGYDLFVIVEGTATVTSGGRAVATLEQGDFFGEIALLGEGVRTATVTAATPVELLVMHGSDFRVFERDWPQASELMKTALHERLARTGATADD
jgi:CRP-like cAMP-binding protein